MKKLTLIIAAVAFSFSIAFSQGCLPDGITFTTQAQIDNFQTNFPGCSVIEGDVAIFGNDISNLNGLSVLDSIYGTLNIESNPLLKNLSGLDNLKMIGQNEWGSLMIWLNDSLNNFEGLERLKTIKGGLYVSSNLGLSSFSGLDSLISIGGSLAIMGNYSLTNISGLENLISIAGDLSIGIEFNGWGNPNPVLTDISALQNLTYVGQSLRIGLNDSLASLSGLDNVTSIGGDLDICGNDALTSLTGLNNVTSIGGGLDIRGNDALASLVGLENIDAGSITGLYIHNNDLLTICEVQSICDYLAAPNGNIEIYDNAPGCNSPEEVDAACATVHTEHIVFNNEIILAPNPFSEQTELRIAKTNKGPIDICIFNIFGICLRSWHFENTSAVQTQFSLDMHGIPPGIYFCRIQIGNETITKKIVKVK